MALDANFSAPGRRGPETLPYGQFYGRFERRYEIPGFSVALITADETSLQAVPHTHESTHFIFILAGEYTSRASRSERVVTSDGVVYVPAGTTHRDRFQTLDSRSLTVSVSAGIAEQVSKRVRLPGAETSFRDGWMTVIGRRLRAECRSWGETSSLTAEALCLEWLAAIAKEAYTGERRPPSWLLAARDVLHDRCTCPVTISEVAAAVCVHPVHLTRTFRRFYHSTPGDYLRNLRVEIAASLLRTGRRSISDVALEAGFSDQSHLSRAFKRRLGVTPAEYRRDTSA